jgi:eukaryotic-like serine/threonine-protein kinase
MQPGDSLDGRYTIVSRLGAGGMGEVYKATHNFLNATRVIKIIHPTISGRQDAHDRFLKEARIATKVQHSNVATLHDFASLADGSHYMVWEFIDGENLAQRLRTQGTLPPRQAVRIALQALRGLEAIHNAGIIHRDISPENLMITADDTVKIIDLGVAKIEDPDEVAQTRTGIFVGKLRYAAPEQLGFLAEGEKIDGRTDLYALAMVLVELLTGRPPYEAKSPHEYFLHHAREVARTTVELPPQLPGSSALRHVLEKALERDRTQRYGSAREFAVALEEIERTLPTAMDTPTMAVPIDGDETMKQRVTKAGTTAPAGFQAPVMAGATAVIATESSAVPTIQTPLPEGQMMPLAQIPPARTRSGINPAILIVAILLLFAGVAGAVVLLKPVELFKRITSARSTNPPQTATTTQAAALSTPAQTTITATPDPVITETTVPTTTQSPALSAPIATTSDVRDLPRPPIAPRRDPTQKAQPQQVTDEDQPAPVEPSRVRAVAVYVDGPGNLGANERALSRLRSDMRGVSKVALHAGALQVQVYRAINRYLPELEFDEESDVVITFDSTNQRLSLDKNDLAARVTIQKNGRPIFRYELPRHYDRSQAADAFARTLAEAFGE